MPSSRFYSLKLKTVALREVEYIELSKLLKRTNKILYRRSWLWGTCVQRLIKLKVKLHFTRLSRSLMNYFYMSWSFGSISW